jgi:hypothetical protein
MAAKFILAIVAAILVIAAATRGFRGPQARIWLTVAAIFVVVSAWLFLRA